MKESAHIVSKVRLATIVEGDQKAPFLIATTLRCWGGRYSYNLICRPSIEIDIILETFIKKEKTLGLKLKKKKEMKINK